MTFWSSVLSCIYYCYFVSNSQDAQQMSRYEIFWSNYKINISCIPGIVLWFSWSDTIHCYGTWEDIFSILGGLLKLFSNLMFMFDYRRVSMYFIRYLCINSCVNKELQQKMPTFLPGYNSLVTIATVRFW